jgi:uncharacterized protein (DUF433 family)
MGLVKGYKFIDIDPEYCHGKARIDNTRISVDMIVRDLSAGGMPEDLVAIFTELSIESVNEAIRYYNEIKSHVDMAH